MSFGAPDRGDAGEAADATFAVPIDGIDTFPDGSSVLLTGSDIDALERVFYAMLAPQPDERVLVLSTVHGAREIGRNLRGVDDPTVITSEGPAIGDAVTKIDDPGDLTTLGMALSARFQELPDQPTRMGLFHSTDLLSAATDTRSVYRFINSNLLTNLRRQPAVGITAIHTDADLESDLDSIVTGMETSFKGRLHVEEADGVAATVTVDGFGADGEEYRLDL